MRPSVVGADEIDTAELGAGEVGSGAVGLSLGLGCCAAGKTKINVTRACPQRGLVGLL